jgi:multiple sugar transport system permease protein
MIHAVEIPLVKKVRKTAFYAALAIILICVLFPIVWMFLASFKSNVDILNTKKLFRFVPSLDNYREVFVTYNFLRPVKNSFIVSFFSTLIALFLSLPAAYVVARERQHLASGIILVIRIIPAITFLVPWYIIFNRMNLSGTYTSLILCHLIISLPLITWIMIPYYETIPIELEQSAWIDGCSRMGTFSRIMLPLSAPGILTAAILAFVFSWNNFLFALILCSSKTITMPIAIYQFIGYAEIHWDYMMAASVIITFPIIIISLFLQRYVVTGLTAGAVKG